MKWAIYYSDGSIFTYQEGDPEDAPVIGVQFIAQEDKDHNWSSLSKDPYYYWADLGDGYRFYAADWVGFFLHLIKPGWKLFFLGEQIGNERFAEISRRVSEDIQVALKTGYAPGERRPNE